MTPIASSTPTEHPDFTVWAPDAETVELAVGQTRHPLSLDPATGWWRGQGPSGPVDYGFVVDGHGPFPDPRSRRQPDGVHSPSQRWDPDAFRWTDRAWHGRPLAGAVIYELHIGTFTGEGTLDAAIGKLGHLRSLGIDFVELLPVNAFNGIHNWGYDGVLWYAVHEPYGGPDAYQRFVDACHGAGIGVIQDVVYNHLGPSGNYLPQFGPYLRTDIANPWGSSVNLDGHGSDEVRRYIIDNALMWLDDFHVDGLRLDAVHALVDHRATPILEELAIEVDELSSHLGRELFLIAESDRNDPKLITSRGAGGAGLEAQWSDDFHHALHVALTGEVTGYYADFAGLSALKKTLVSGFFHDGTLSTFRGRHHGRPIDTQAIAPSGLVVFSQNHDQVGNRAAGDRLTATLNDGQLAIAAALTLLGPYTPMLFMGEEWAASTPWQFFTSHPEKELGDATARGRIAEFERMGWDKTAVPDPQDAATFTRSVLDWTEPDGGRHARLLELYRDLVRLRRERADLTDPRFGTIRVELVENAPFENAPFENTPFERALVLRRTDTTIAVNFAASAVTISSLPGLTGADMLLSFGGHELAGDGLVLNGHSLVVADTSGGGPTRSKGHDGLNQGRLSP